MRYFLTLVLFKPRESGGETEKDQRKNDRHQINYSLLLLYSFGVNGPSALWLIVLTPKNIDKFSSRITECSISHSIGWEKFYRNGH